MHMACVIEFPIVSFTRRVYNLIFRVSIADFRWMKPEIKLIFLFTKHRRFQVWVRAQQKHQILKLIEKWNGILVDSWGRQIYLVDFFDRFHEYV